ncbi:hypothetical protein FB45DRAFT_31503 [Roridomyces roridus]|uniref:Uncharacterized protein n=1 Tax=Roridomyces roridus TaxID=1738132 RepID=A0AAD7CKP2_9AGAR|nr:hypothetical protein FB45DRAFT_31503 [Roridomyces roridus]
MSRTRSTATRWSPLRALSSQWPTNKSTRTNSRAARTICDAKLAGNGCTRCYSACPTSSTLPWLYSTRIQGEGWWRYERGRSSGQPPSENDVEVSPPSDGKAGVTFTCSKRQPLAGVYNKRCRALYPQVPDSHLLSSGPSQRPSSPMVTAVGCNRSTTRHDIHQDDKGDAAANPTPAPSQRSSGPLSISVWRKVPARMRRRRLPLLEGLVLPWLW